MHSPVPPKQLPHVVVGFGPPLLAGPDRVLDGALELAYAPGDLIFGTVHALSLPLKLAFITIHPEASAILPVQPWVGLGPQSQQACVGEPVMAQVVDLPRPGKAIRVDSHICLSSLHLLAWPGASGWPHPARPRCPRGFLGVVYRPTPPRAGPRRCLRESCDMEHQWEHTLLRTLAERRRTTSSSTGTMLPVMPSWLSWFQAQPVPWVLAATLLDRTIVGETIARYSPWVQRQIEAGWVCQSAWYGWSQSHRAATWQPRLPLPSGGAVVLDPTEACWVADINSGDGSIEKANWDAVLCLLHQMGLRHLTGMLVVDMITTDWYLFETLMGRWCHGLRQDPARSHVVAWGRDGVLRVVRSHANYPSSLI